MNDHTIALVRESFDLIEPIAPQAGAMFYANLFEADPSLQGLFKSDTEARGATLMQAVAAVVASLDEPALLLPALRQLGQAHAIPGLHETHVDTVRAALLKTLYQSLGVAYNDEVEGAWVDAYAVLWAKTKEAVVLAA